MSDIAVDQNPPLAGLSPEHEGSASPQLSGQKVLFSWILSILFHAFALGGMYLLVFPYVAAPADVEHVVTFAQVAGDIDATGTAPVPPSQATPAEDAQCLLQVDSNRTWPPYR